MLTRTLLLALTAAATLGAATLTTTSNADAHGWRWHRHWERPHSEVQLQAAIPSATFGSSAIKSLLKISPSCPEVNG